MLLRMSLAALGMAGALSAAAGELKFDDPALAWTGMKMESDATELGALKLSDIARDGGAYLVTGKKIAVDPAEPTTLSVLIKTAGDVTGRSQAHLFIFDKAGKRIGALSTPGVTAQTWTESRLDLKPGEWPAGAASAQIALQPAAGPAEATGTAYFKELYFGKYLEPKLDLRFQPNRIKWTGMAMKFSAAEPDAVMLEDTSAAGGPYLESGDIPIDPTKDYRASVEVKTSGNVTSRSQMHIFFYDRAGKRIGAVSSGGTTSSEWTTLSYNLPASKRPADARSIRIVLQSAAGPAIAVGTAWFRKVELMETEKVPPLSAVDRSQEFFFKSNRVNLARPNLMSSDFERPGARPRLEMSMREPMDIDTVRLVGRTAIPEVQVALWNEARQAFDAPSAIKTAKIPGGCEIRFPQAIYTRRLAVEFPIGDRIDLDDVNITGPRMPEESWHANWIWFTADRVEDILTWFRGEFTLESVPEHAYIQSAVDDGGVLYVNGRRLGDAGGRERPPVRDIASYLKAGKNVIAAETVQARYAAGLIVELDMIWKDGSHRKFISDKNWKIAKAEHPGEGWNNPDFDSSGWMNTVELGVPPNGAWGKVGYTMNAPRIPLKLAANPVPAQLSADQQYSYRLAVTPAQAGETAPAILSLKRGGLDFFRQRIGVIGGTAEPHELQLKFALSKFLVPGEYSLEVTAAGYKPLKWNVTVTNDRKVKFPNAEVRSRGGVPVLEIAGRPEFPDLSARLLETLDAHGALFAATGLHRYFIYTTLEWDKAGQPDFTNVDRTVAILLNGDPQAEIFIRSQLRDSVPGWFSARYPDECVKFDNGRSSSRASLASPVWRQIAGENIAGLVRHVAASPYADRVIGFMVSEGEEGQWMHYWAGETPNQPGTLSDYSKPMLDYFRNWLRQNYSTEAALQAAWNDPAVTFDNAEIPTREARIAGEGVFRKLPRDRAALDFAFALSDVITEGMDYYGKLIKETAAPSKVLTGALYGHLIDLGACFLGEQVGYLRQRRAIDSPYMDVYCGPLSYAGWARDNGGVGSFDMPSPASLKLVNKIWINEEDVRTHLEYPAGYAYSIRTPDATSQMIAREAAKAMCAGAGMYWFALGTSHQNWFDDPETARTLGELQKILDESVTRDRSKTAEIAVVYCDQAVGMLRSLPPREKADMAMLRAIYQREQIGRIGAPYDEYLVDDLAKSNMPAYKFYIFLNAFSLSDDEIAAIQAKLARDGAVALWHYAPALATLEGLDVKRSEKATKIAFKLDTTRRPGRFELAKAIEKLPKGTPYGNAEQTFAPFLIPQKSDDVLATFAGTNIPAVTRHGKSYFAALGELPPELLRQMAENAGVDILSRDNIAVYGCASYVAIHSSKVQGPMNLKAPKGRQLRQLWPLDRSADWITEYSWENERPATRIFEVK